MQQRPPRSSSRRRSAVTRRGRLARGRRASSSRCWQRRSPRPKPTSRSRGPILQTAQLNLGYTEIRAPIDGYVGNRAAQVGAYVAAGRLPDLGHPHPTGCGWMPTSRKTSSPTWSTATPPPWSPTCCPAMSSMAMSPAWRPAPARSSASFRQRTPPATSPRSCSACRSASCSTPTTPSCACCGPGFRPRAGRYARRAEAGAVIDVSEPPHPPSILPFVVMCVGMFIALLDIQIVASSLQDIGGGLSAAQDEISWVQTAYLIAEIIMIPLSGWLTRVFSTRWLFTVSAAGFTAGQHAVRPGLEHPEHDRLPRVAGPARRVDDPDRVHVIVLFLPGPRRVYSAAVVGTIASIAPTLGPVIGGWITDTLNWHWLFYINLVPGIVITVAGADAGAHRRAGPVAAARRGLPRDRADGDRPGHAGIHAGGRHALELVQRFHHHRRPPGSPAWRCCCSCSAA